MQKLRIFAASPSDMATERAKVETVAAMLKPLADNLDIVLEVSDWRAVVPDMGRPEQVILDQLKPTEWDVLIGILWHRFGTPPGGEDPGTQKEYLAGTEEEFKTAYSLWKQSGKPRIMMYRCSRAIPQDALDPDQFKRAKEFFAQFDAVKGEHPGLFQSFDTADAFEKLLLNNLQRFLLDNTERIKGKPVAPKVVQTYAPKIPDNLPRRGPFFGRDKDMETALRALSPEDRTWGVLVDGIGGIGKSALAVEAAYRCKEKRRFDAFIFVSAKQDILATDGIRAKTPEARTLDEFLNETARVLGQPGIPKLAGDYKRRALIDELRSTRALLIYDNLETLTREEQEALADFLRELPQACKAVITSRRRGGEGAVWLRLEQLEWKAGRDIIKDAMACDARLANKLQLAGEARWQELYDETKGSPLALMHTLGLMRVRRTLSFDGALELLRYSGETDLQKFIFKEAHKELSPSDQAALCALFFFSPSASFEAWMESAALSRNALETTIDRLSDLSLLDAPVGERYALHPLTRNFVRDELMIDVQFASVTGKRFAEHWVIYAQRNGGNRENYKTFELLEAEWANFDAAAEWLWKSADIRDKHVGDKKAALMLNDLAAALSGEPGALFLSGRWDDSASLSARAYEAVRALDNWREAGRRARHVALIHYHRGNIGEAQRWVGHYAEAASHDASEDESAEILRLRALMLIQSFGYPHAERLLQQALKIWRTLNLDLKISIVLNDLGSLERSREKYDVADQYFREALVLDEKFQNKEGMVVRRCNLGSLAIDRERWAEAREWLEKALPLAREVGRHDSIATAQFGLARVHEEERRADLALPLAEEAREIRERLRSGGLEEANTLVERLRKAVTGN